ncbi:MAG: hypothetical protein KDA68_15865 [Planctomycetaceae bacterium]|nr:hypothetical protein [Planctomycetaceae bacterium]
MQKKELLFVSYAYDFRDGGDAFDSFSSLQLAFPQMFSRVKAGVWVHGLRKARTAANLKVLSEKVVATGANQLQITLPKLDLEINSSLKIRSFCVTIDISPFNCLWSTLKEGVPKTWADRRSRRHFASYSFAPFYFGMSRFPTITKTELVVSIPTDRDPSESLSLMFHKWLSSMSFPEMVVGHAGYHELESVSQWLDRPFVLDIAAYEFIDQYPDSLFPIMFRPRRQLDKIGTILGYSGNIENISGGNDSTAVMWIPQSVATSSLHMENANECMIPRSLYERRIAVEEEKGLFRFSDNAVYYTKSRWNEISQFQLPLEENQEELEMLPHPKYLPLLNGSDEVMLVRPVPGPHLAVFQSKVDEHYQNSPTELSPKDRAIWAYRTTVDSTDMFRSERYAIMRIFEQSRM